MDSRRIISKTKQKYSEKSNQLLLQKIRIWQQQKKNDPMNDLGLIYSELLSLISPRSLAYVHIRYKHIKYHTSETRVNGNWKL